MKTFAKFLAVVAILGLVASVNAADKPKGEKKPGISGKVVKVDGTNLIIKNKDGEKTIATDASTVVKVDGKEAKLSDVQPDMQVMVQPDTGTAKTINARTPKPKANK